MLIQRHIFMVSFSWEQQLHGKDRKDTHFVLPCLHCLQQVSKDVEQLGCPVLVITNGLLWYPDYILQNFTNHGCRSEANPGDLHRSKLNSHTMTPSWLHDHHELNLSSGSWKTNSPNVRRRAEARFWRVCEIAQRLWKTWRLVVILSQSLFDPYYPALLVLVQMSNAEFLLLLHYLHFLRSQNVKNQLWFLFFIGSWMHWTLQILLVSMMFFAMILLAKSAKYSPLFFPSNFFSH